jgi:ribosomal protein L40E
MSRRRTVGYIENEWTCPNCGTRNKGSVKTCENCGAPQPENVQFELGADQKFVTDAEKVKAAKAGPDIHCGYCGARNPATADTCSQCGGDLKEGKAREAGRLMQAPPAPPKAIKCNNCGTENPGTNLNCSNCGASLPRVTSAQTQAAAVPPAAPAAPMAGGKDKKRNLLAVGGVFACLAVICAVIVAVFMVPTKTLEGTVTAVHWETNVPVQELVTVRHSDEQGSPPSDAYDVSCHTEESCHQETRDTGSGFSEVVEVCNDVQYCSYTVDEWKTVQTYTLEGNDLQPIYDTPSLSSGQRLGDESETLTVYFSTEEGEKTYTPNTIEEFKKFIIGTTWELVLNVLGGVVSVN